mmetsp:Transcript_20270/g.52953  ORF Transcript_20270/g.52953 Transcript_20270/m.52953 type:complete len:245 (+) Transcript_20270:384-1118(+)
MQPPLAVEPRQQRDELRYHAADRDHVRHPGLHAQDGHRLGPQRRCRHAQRLQQLVQHPRRGRRPDPDDGDRQHLPRRRVLLAQDPGRERRLHRDPPVAVGLDGGQRYLRPLRLDVRLERLDRVGVVGGLRAGGRPMVRLPDQAARRQRRPRRHCQRQEEAGPGLSAGRPARWGGPAGCCADGPFAGRRRAKRVVGRAPRRVELRAAADPPVWNCRRLVTEAGKGHIFGSLNTPRMFCMSVTCRK